MTLLRTLFISKSISVILLLIFLQLILQPYYVLALTTGPQQPEFMSYEEPGATDMVNLLTGDFTFSLPILEVPGPEGSFSLPLSYHGGIGLEQEASWVGLGFSINAGNISRSLNQFPDDAAGESQSITVQDLNAVYGYHMTNGLFTTGWNNQTGSYGAVSLFGIVSAEWSESQSTSVGLMGVSVGSGQVDFDPVQFMSAVMTIGSWGAAGAAAEAGKAGLAISKAVAMDIASTAVSSTANNVFSSGGAPAAPTSGYWQYSKRTKRIGLLGKTYRIWLDKTRKEKMFGALYLGKVSNMQPLDQTGFPWLNISLAQNGASETLYEFPKAMGSVNEGAASDINYDQGSNYSTTTSPVSLAFDDYTVRAAGISGSIVPYRMDVGAVSMPRQMTKYHTRLAPVRYLDYKVPFVYEGAISNAHFHNTGGASSPTVPGFYSGVDIQVGNADPYQNHSLTYSLNDVVFNNERLKPGLDPVAPKIAQANHIEWLSNEDIVNYPYPSKFIDFLAASDRGTFRSNFTLASSSITSTTTSYSDNFSTTIKLTPSVIGSFFTDMPITLNIQFYDDATLREEGTGATYKTFNVTVQSVDNANNTIVVSSDSEMVTFYGKYADIEVRYSATPQIQKAIGGFCITSVDGVTYHFALPIYDYDWKTEIKDVSNPNNRKSIISRSSPFANNWLLTAITGPDFIDRNDNGIADDDDWGYWIKFNYGNHADDYKWRLPYGEELKRSPDNLYDSYTEGFRQIYYLNTIETRSHVALFLKSERDDGRGLNSKTVMKLDEICLLKKEAYQKLVKSIGQGGFGIPEFSNKVNQLCLTTSFNTGSSAREFIDLNCLKRVVFAYSYDLCPNTSNSVATAMNSNQGKLTLARLSILGRNNLKIVPDYKFEYGPNPAYNQNYWDGWGYYNPTGSSYVGSHRTPSTSAGDGTAWSLIKIVTPLGSEVIVNQERDTYSSISGQTIYSQDYSYGYGYTDTDAETDLSNNRIRSSAPLVLGDKVLISGTIEFKCSMSSSFEVQDYSGERTVDHSDGTFVYFSGTNYAGISCPTAYDVQQNTGTFKQIITSRKGGNLRVASIVNKDAFGSENRIQYLYNDDNGQTSGVVSREPDYIKDQLDNFDQIPGYPYTPVLYTKVSVLTGKLSTLTDYHTKYVYEFEPPSPALISVDKQAIKPRSIIFQSDGSFYPADMKEYGDVYQYNISNRTTKIGSLKKISVFNSTSSSAVSQTEFVYAPPNQILNDNVNNYQGVYAESVLMFDRVAEDNSWSVYNKASRTTTLTYPNALEKIVTTKDGLTSETKNLSWDFITGIVLQKLEKSPLGISTKTVIRPAYEIYPEMGSKASSLSNKNMLSATAARFIYRSDDAGNQLGIIGASVQTWKKDWVNYRYYSSSTGAYEDADDEPLNFGVWRKEKSYMWKGDYSRLQEVNGKQEGIQSFLESDEFDFSPSASNPGWQNTGELLRFDHYGAPLETKDLNNIYSATKMGYDHRIVIATAVNGTYNDIAFSSAEDEDPATGFFGGEVQKKDALGDATVVRKTSGGDAHTGQCALSLSTAHGFIFKPVLRTGKRYKVLVWTNSEDGRLYYNLNGQGEVLSSAPVSTRKVGNWYLLEQQFEMNGAFTSCEVGVKSAGGQVLFDDFRFQPVDAVMTCHVYDPLDKEYAPDEHMFEYVLNNNNFFTQFEYDGRGRLIKTYQESIKYGVTLLNESKDNYRRFHVDQ